MLMVMSMITIVTCDNGWSMDSLTSGTPNPTNNPRMNLLNGSGTNNQINTTTANAFEASAFHARPVPQPNPINSTPLAAANSAPKAEYVKAASKKAPEAPKPAPAPAPAAAETPTPPPPEPRPVPTAPEPPKSRKPLIIGLILLLLFAIAAAVGWWFLNQPKKEEPKAPTKQIEAVNPTELKQATTDGQEITAGGTSKQKSVKLSFTLETDANSGAVTPEAEVRPMGTAFTGEATHTGSEVSANGSNLNPGVTVENLENGQYHWQVRVKVGEQSSEWIAYGDSAATTPSFIVEASAAAAAATAVQSVSGVAVANPTNVTSANPVFTGTSEPNATITVSIGDKSFKGTASASGSWTVTADQTIANGQHQVNVTATDSSGATVGQTQLTLVIAVPAAAAATPAPAASSSAPAATATAPAASESAATQDQTLAATGDNAVTLSTAGAAALALSVLGLVWARRRYANFF